MGDAYEIDLIHRNVHVDAVRDDLDTIVLDAGILEAVLGAPDPEKKATELEIRISMRLRKHEGNPADICQEGAPTDALQVALHAAEDLFE